VNPRTLVIAAVLAIGVTGTQSQTWGAPKNSSATAFRVLTYNVAGLPEGLSNSNPTTNLPLVGAKLHAFDLALIQEDFAYADLLRKNLKLPYASRAFERGERYDFGDGLSQFAKAPFSEPERIPWTSCHGITGYYFDCLTPKGVSFARLRITAQDSVDVYNLHMDAGHSSGDRAAREAQLGQLVRVIQERSADRAVILGGDFNLGASESGSFRDFERQTGLRDACARVGCPEPGRIDRILSRSGARVRLAPKRWRVDRSFVDAGGRALSDHVPIVVDFALEAAGADSALRPSAPVRPNESN
jgi:endonuclease/exonuclease/phosphatase family metal-dependent hydrolase